MVCQLAELFVDLGELIRAAQQRPDQWRGFASREFGLSRPRVEAGVELGDVVPVVLVGALVWGSEEYLFMFSTIDLARR